MSQINLHVRIGVKLAIDQLTDEELLALIVAVNVGKDPRNIIGYDKVKGLFTVADGTKMHSDVEHVFASIANQRIR